MLVTIPDLLVNRLTNQGKKVPLIRIRVWDLLSLSEQLTNKSEIEGTRLTNQGKRVPDSDPDRGSQTLSESVDQQIRDSDQHFERVPDSECKTRFRVSS